MVSMLQYLEYMPEVAVYLVCKRCRRYRAATLQVFLGGYVAHRVFIPGSRDKSAGYIITVVFYGPVAEYHIIHSGAAHGVVHAFLPVHPCGYGIGLLLRDGLFQVYTGQHNSFGIRALGARNYIDMNAQYQYQR